MGISGGMKDFFFGQFTAFLWKCHMKCSIREVGEGVTLGVICHIFAKHIHTHKLSLGRGKIFHGSMTASYVELKTVEFDDNLLRY